MEELHHHRLTLVPPHAVCIRQHTSRQHAPYVSIRHTSAYVSFTILARLLSHHHTSAYVSIRQHTIESILSTYVSIHQHTSAYVSIRMSHSCPTQSSLGNASGWRCCVSIETRELKQVRERSNKTGGKRSI